MSSIERLGEAPRWFQWLYLVGGLVAQKRPVLMTAGRRHELIEAEWRSKILMEMRDEFLRVNPPKELVVDCNAPADPLARPQDQGERR